MNTSLALAYPADRSLLRRLLLPMVSPRAYLRATHLALMFPLGLAYFVFFVTAFAFGGALIWTFVGPPVLLLALFVSLYIGDLEAWKVNLATGEGIHRPPKVLEGALTLRDKVWTRVIDPSTWTGVLYEVAQFPIGIAAFILVVVGFSVSGSFIGAPVIAWLEDEAVTLDLFGGITIDGPLEALVLVPFGLVSWCVTMHAVTLFSSLHAFWARFMLGSRARHRPRAEQPGAPDPTPGTPVAALAPVEPAAADVGGPILLDEPHSYGAGRYAEQAEAVDGLAEAGEPGVNPALQELTAREREVLLLVARGYSNADICEACYISEGTVKTHVRHILGKLGLTDRTQLIVFAYEQGIVTPSQRPIAASIARSPCPILTIPLPTVHLQLGYHQSAMVTLRERWRHPGLNPGAANERMLAPRTSVSVSRSPFPPTP
jgi:DNA-binding CsgD family transcriptional regulator